MSSPLAYRPDRSWDQRGPYPGQKSADLGISNIIRKIVKPAGPTGLGRRYRRLRRRLDRTCLAPGKIYPPVLTIRKRLVYG